VPGRLGLYDDYAKRVLAVAQDEAWRVFHRDSIAAEHLLLGVLRCGAGDREGWIVPSLKSLGLDVVTVRNALEKIRTTGDRERQIDEIPFTLRETESLTKRQRKPSRSGPNASPQNMSFLQPCASQPLRPCCRPSG
jgi:hypothetical protein